MKKTETEVIIVLAKFLIDNKMIVGDVHISLDGMHKKVFPNWKKEIDNWQQIVCNSKSGCGDVVATFNEEFANKIGKSHIHIECKKGFSSNAENSQEYKLMREAIGQIATLAELKCDTLYSIAIPSSKRTIKLRETWKDAYGIKKLGIKILLIDENNSVIGLESD